MAHSSSRPGVITRSLSKGGRNLVVCSTDDIHEVANFDHVTQEEISNLVSSQSSGTLHERCLSEGALNQKNLEVNMGSGETSSENRKLKQQLTDVSNQLTLTEDSLNEAEHDVANTKRDLFDTMQRLLKVTDEVSSYEKLLNDSNEQNWQLRQDMDKVNTEKVRLEFEMKDLEQVKIENVRLGHELKNKDLEIQRLKSELHSRSGTVALSITGNNSALQSDAVVQRYDSGQRNVRYNQTGIGYHSNSTSSYGAVEPRKTFSRDSGSISHPDEPKFRLPYFNGRGDFPSFWAIFEIGIKKFQRDGEKQIEHLMCSLKDEALAFVTKLPVHIKGNIMTLYSALDQRYGDHFLPEQYREQLNQVKKNSKETMVEYATRVEEMVNKAYPELSPPHLVTSLTIEHIFRGLSDQNLSYEVRTKEPKTIDETLRLLSWHECCRNGNKRQVSVRQVEENMEDDSHEIRKVGNHGNGKQYVTEDKLKEMKNQIVSNLTDEINKLAATLKQKGAYRGNDESHEAKRARYADVTCYKCHAKGHTSRFCPLNKEGKGNFKQRNETEKRPGYAENQGKNAGGYMNTEKKSLN